MKCQIIFSGDLTFYANCLGDNLHKMSISIFWVKNRKNIFKCRLLIFFAQ